MIPLFNGNPSDRLRASDQRGMTLIELLLAMALASVVLVATSGLAGLIVRSAGQRDTIHADRRATERVMTLIDAELKQLTQVIEVSPSAVTYETVYAPLEDEPGRYRVQIICIKNADHWVLMHQSQPMPSFFPGSQSQSVQDAKRYRSIQATVSRQLYGGLTECALEMGVRMSDASSGAVYIKWVSAPDKVGAAPEWWLRVHMATEQGVHVPLFLGKMKSGA